MASQPPPLPGQSGRKSLKFAGALNMFLPGAGLIYLGRPVAGLILAAAFLICFIAMLALFLAGYSRYLSIAMSDDLMRGDNLERAGDSFHQPWLVALAIAGGIIYLVSSVLFTIAKRRFRETT
jgi:hypothetical protein